MAPNAQVTLIPWDPESVTHRQWLIRQRDECGWDQDKVETTWKEYQTKGYKCIYWIVSGSYQIVKHYKNSPVYTYTVVVLMFFSKGPISR